jgi:acyl-CoA synthetase (AMP-forming)/AMP-acid ligase II
MNETFAKINATKKNKNASEEEINDFCAALPRYKRPRKIIFDKVPRNPTGKIEKPVLRQRYCGSRLVEAQISG